MDLVAEAVDHLDSDALTNTIIIGDTPLDITAARSGGVKVIAVATGAVSEQKLAEHNPDGLLPSIDAAVFAALVDQILRT
jgi:phosphoglycolate phosphatase-like HAD superfamily hydrolase